MSSITTGFLLKYASAKKELKVTLDKTEMGQGFKYTALPDITSEINPVLDKNGLVLIQVNVGDPAVGVGIKTGVYEIEGDGYIEETITVPYEVSEQRGLKSGNLVMSKIQGIGATITYLRRYGIVTILGMATEDDADNKNIYREKKKQAAKTITQEQADAILKIDKNNILPDLLQKAGFEDVMDVPINRYGNLFNVVKERNSDNGK